MNCQLKPLSDVVETSMIAEMRGAGSFMTHLAKHERLAVEESWVVIREGLFRMSEEFLT